MSVNDIILSAAGGTSADVNYIDSVFSTYLYTGNGSTQTITNGIDLASEGGLVWIKQRTTQDHVLYDTARGVAAARLSTNNTNGQNTTYNEFSSFNSDGFSLAYNIEGEYVNKSATTYASWTFRKAPKFFDVVTYTGTGVAQAINHSLGSTPGMVIVKSTDLASQWYVYHKGLNGGVTPEQYYIFLSLTNEQASNSVIWNDTAPTSTQFTVGTAAGLNNSGSTYVAYLFAHNAGGFGASGTDNVISCGSFTTDGSGKATVNLGYEPQYVLVKTTDIAGSWIINDSMRGMPVNANSINLYANSAAQEFSNDAIYPNATGFSTGLIATSAPHIYMAIRRPMKVPTTGTEVFNSVARTGTGANATVSSGFVTDTVLVGHRTSTATGRKFGAFNRSRGVNYLLTPTTDAEVAAGTTIVQANPWDVMDGYKVGTTGVLTNGATAPYINWMFKRASGFHDVVCYTGNSTAGATQAHNLGVVPELMIVKKRTGTTVTGWTVYSSALGATKRLVLNTTATPITDSGDWNDTAPTSTVFTLGFNQSVNNSASTYVAYLFATCPGVSKVGSYTGNGTTQAISCGFTGGARFVLIKRTDSTGDWYVYDTARGMTTLVDPYLLLNSTAAESATLGSVTTTTGGFTVNASILAAINTSGASYIFLAIA